jgi:hypothetical protein
MRTRSLSSAAVLAALLAGPAMADSDPITYPVPAGSRWHLWDTAAQGIIPPPPPAADRAWPVLAGAPIQGIDPATYPYRWLLIEHRGTVESYDPRTHTTVTVTEIEIEPAPSVLGRWIRQAHPVLLPPDDLARAVWREYHRRVALVVPDEAEAGEAADAMLTGALLLGATAHSRMDGVPVPPAVAAQMETWAAVVQTYILACRQRRDAMLAEVDAMRGRLAASEPAGSPPELDAGWPTRPEPPAPN